MATPCSFCFTVSKLWLLRTARVPLRHKSQKRRHRSCAGICVESSVGAVGGPPMPLTQVPVTLLDPLQKEDPPPLHSTSDLRPMPSGQSHPTHIFSPESRPPVRAILCHTGLAPCSHKTCSPLCSHPAMAIRAALLSTSCSLSENTPAP